jgi:hypothetical protein
MLFIKIVFSFFLITQAKVNRWMVRSLETSKNMSDSFISNIEFIYKDKHLIYSPSGPEFGISKMKRGRNN